MSVMFSSIKIGKMEIKNRFVHSATHEVMSTDDGQVTDDLIRRYKSLAKGETGLIIPGHMYVHPLGQGHHGQTSIFSDSMIPGLKRLTKAVHEHDGKIVFQISHIGRQSPKEIINHAPLAPSGWGRDPVTLNKPVQMNETVIRETITAFKKAAERAIEAEADGIQLHGAHGYLINQFLSPFFNRRKDSWGGSDKNRFRFLKEIILTIKNNVSSELPILVKFNTNDFTPKKGITPDLAATYAKWMIDAGVDAIETSCGTGYSFHAIRGEIPAKELISALPFWMKPIGKMKLNHMAKSNTFEHAYNLDAAKSIKPVVGDTPLILVGGMRKLSQMETIVRQNQADMISMSRPFIREPLLVKKFREGKTGEASCISCNKCFAAMFNSMPVRCYKNGVPGL